MINLDNVLKSRDITLPTKVCLSSQSYGFSSSHVWMWELDHKEGWMLKNWCFWTVVLEQTPENPLDCKEIQPVNPKGNQSWIFIGRTDAEAPILWPPDAKTWLIRKDPEAGKDWGQGEEDDRGWDGWMASLTQWTWVWVSSGSWWWTGKPGLLQSMGSQTVRHNWETKLKIFPGKKFRKVLGNPLVWGMRGRESWLAPTSTQVQSLAWKYPLEMGMATYSGILTWKIPWMRGGWQAPIHGVAKN